MDGSVKVNRTVYLNPESVISIERASAITTVRTTGLDYYTDAKPEHIMEGLKNVQERNNMLLMLN
jgi:hypothetical protein